MTEGWLSMKNTKKLVVISIDALVSEDLKYLSTLPAFGNFMETGARVEHIRTIYPSSTYPAHTSMVTGAYPGKHGIINNEELQIGKKYGDWNWFHKGVRIPDIFEAAKKAGLATASVFWPVTGCHPYIDYLIDEYWPQWDGDDAKSAFLRSGTTEELFEKVVSRYINGLKIRTHPQTDNFVVDCACDIIRAYKPDLVMLHTGNIDAYRHNTGVFSARVTQGLQEVERWLEQLISATKNAGVFEDTNFVVTSDHGQLNITRSIHLNVLLKEAGFISANAQGELCDWQAYCKSAGLSAQIYLKDPNNRNIYERLYAFLCSLKDEQVYGISEVYTTEEIDHLEHLKDDFSFVVETDGYTSFGDNWMRPLIDSFTASDYLSGKANGGHLPHKGPQPVFLLNGPDIKKGIIIDHDLIINEAPTYAKLLGIHLPDADGVCMDFLLK